MNRTILDRIRILIFATSEKHNKDQKTDKIDQNFLHNTTKIRKKIGLYEIKLYLCRKINKKNTTMESDEITDQISQEVELSNETVDFDLRDAVIYSTILERKYN